MSSGSTLGRVLGSGSANRGFDHWWGQRLTALALVPFGVWFGASLLCLPRLNYATLAHWLQQSWNAVLLVAFILVAARHSYLGVRVVVEDYVHASGTRIAMLITLLFTHALLVAVGVFAALTVAFGNVVIASSS